MKLESAKHLDEIEMSEGVETIDFSIEGNALAFEVLSAKLYSDRIKAIIRELSANAADSHIDAGKIDTPFHIQLPNSLSSKFRLRDYGTGLAPDLVKKLYTRYFKSTKTNDNTQTGCMGLGSKSPFAYVESFTVNSYWNGRKYVFSAVKKKGLPTIVPMNGVEGDPTEEPNGLEIEFPVASSDHWQFQQKVKEALRFFTHKPTISGIHELEFEKFDYMLGTDRYGIVSSRDDSYVIMGNIGYPIQEEEFENTAYELTDKEKKLINWGVHLFVPIGAVSVAASREKLTYEEDTRKTVKEILADAVVSIEAEAQKKLADAKTVWEARCLFGSVRKGVLGEICDLKDESVIEWNGRKIQEVIHLDDYTFDIRPRVEKLTTKPEDSSSRRRRRNSRPGVTANNGLRRWAIDSFSVNDCTVIFVNDVGRGAYSTAKRYMDEHAVENAFMFSVAPDEFVDDVDCRHLLVPVSTLPKPERAPRGSRQSFGRTERTTLQRFDGYTFNNEEVDLEDGGVYIETRRDKVKWPYRYGSDQFSFQDASCLRELRSLLQTLGVHDAIYGIRPCDKIKLEKHEGWISFEQLLKITVEEHLDEFLPKAKLARSKLDMKFLQLEYHSVPDFGDSPIKKVIELAKQIDALKNDKYVSAWRDLAYHIQLTIETDERGDEFEKIYKLYPLLRSIGYWGGSGDHGENTADEIARYIRLVDMENECDAEMTETKPAEAA